MKRGELPERQQINIILNQGGVGDDICRLPAVKYILDNYPYVDLLLVVADYFKPIAEHFFSGRCKILSFSEMTEEHFKQRFLQTKVEMHTSFHTHLVDHAFRNLVDMDVGTVYKNYLQFDLNKIETKFEMEAPYVVITTGFTAPVRKLSDQTVNEIADYCRKKNYQVVFLGSRKTERGTNGLLAKWNAEQIVGNFSTGIDFSKGVDLRDSTTLLEAAKIIDGSTCIVGLDNGLLHVAGGTRTFILAAYTNAAPEHRLPIRNSVLGWNCRAIVPESCCHCQSSSNFLPNHDFRNCIYDDDLCSSQLTSDKFIKVLEEVL